MSLSFFWGRKGTMQEKIAIVGGGIAGLTAAYLLNKKYDITLFEKSGRIGGNAYTHRTKDGIEVDIAVAAFGKAGYKNFYRMLDAFEIKTSMCPASYMSIYNLDTKKGLYFTPLSLRGLVAQKFALLKPGNILSFMKINRALKKLKKMLTDKELDGITLRGAIDRIPELRGDALLLFMFALCLLSSMYYEEVMDSPARFFVEKLTVHDDVMSPKSTYSVQCVTEKTKAYVDALSASFIDKIVFHANIGKVARNEKEITVRMEDGGILSFDKIVFACPADTAFKLLERPTEKETNLLGAWKYKDGAITVHKDHSSFPKRDLIQAYTFLYTERDGSVHTSVNGALWHEPGAPKDCNYISSQHPNFPVKEELIDFQTVFRTPVYDERSYATIRHLPLLNSGGNTFYCGSYFGFGLHEDAVSSAINVCKKLGVEWS